MPNNDQAEDRANSALQLLDSGQQLLLQQSTLGQELLDIFHNQSLQCVFQPIVDLKERQVCGFEGLVRGPFKSVLHHPLHLFKVAAEQNVLFEMDSLARFLTIQAYARQSEANSAQHLFLNISINAVMDSSHKKGYTLKVLEALGVPPSKVVIEITELQPIEDSQAFIEALSYYRAAGFKVAIDDLGTGYNGLKTWSEIRPDYVKIDRHFVQDVHLHADKKAFMETMLNLATSMGTKLIAEGVETEAELAALMALGVDYVQGFLFQKPAAKLSLQLNYVWPKHPYDKGYVAGEQVREILQPHPVCTPKDRVEAISRKFLQAPEIDFYPVLDGEKVIGMIWRRELMNKLAERFGKELHSRKFIHTIMDSKPLIVDASDSLVELSRVVTENAQLRLQDAFIVVENDQYIGVGTFRDLLRKITDLKVQTAQYANPLSGLPGNVPIQNWLSRLLRQTNPFFIAYVDVDNFKPFNDFYSFEEGDKVISLIANTLKKVTTQALIEKKEAFIGHIGGDDFVVVGQDMRLYQSWAEQIIHHFNKAIVSFYLPEDVARGGIEGVDRHGKAQFFPIMSLSIGVLLVNPAHFEHIQKLSAMATKAKKGAKKAGGNTWHVEDAT